MEMFNMADATRSSNVTVVISSVVISSAVAESIEFFTKFALFSVVVMINV